MSGQLQKSAQENTLFGQIGFLFLAIFLVSFYLGACSSMSNLPEKKNVKVERSLPDPDDKCEELGPVRGASINATAKPEEVLENMVQEAADKGANYLYVEQYSAQKTAARGRAFKCP
jgi:hypothetical protein